MSAIITVAPVAARDRLDLAEPAIAISSESPVCLPVRLRRRGARILNQQFWLWGQDIRRAEGNLLLAHGFAKERPPAGVQGSRAYTLRLGGDRAVVLWGFGLFYGEAAPGGVYLSRFRPAPLLLDQANPPTRVWLPSQVSAHRTPEGMAEWERARPLVVAALAWIGGYERWVERTIGSAARAAMLEGWPRAACPAADLASFWFRLAWAVDSSLRRALAR